MEILNYFIAYSSSPSIHEMLEYDLWEMHEAVFLLTQWPDYIFKCYCEDAAKKTNLPRMFFYQPAGDFEHPTPFQWRFNPNKMGLNFLKTYNLLKEAILRGNLHSRVEYLGIGDVYEEGRSHLLSPEKVIRWALLNNINLPEDFQEAIGVHTMNEEIEKTIQNKVKNKIVGQFLRAEHPKMSITDCCKHPWMMQSGTAKTSTGNEYRTIRNALNELNQPDTKRERKQGRRSKKDIENEQYYPKALEEVIYKESSGIRRYNIPLLKLAMKTAASVLQDQVVTGSFPGMNLNKFLEEFMKHKVISLYTEEAPPIILEFIQMFAEASVADFFLWRGLASQSNKFTLRKHTKE